MQHIFLVIYAQNNLPANITYKLVIFVAALTGIATILGGIIGGLNDLLELKDKLFPDQSKKDKNSDNKSIVVDENKPVDHTAKKENYFKQLKRSSSLDIYFGQRYDK